MKELIALLRYLRLCMKKPYEVFLQFGGYDQSYVLIEKSKARLQARLHGCPHIVEWLQQLAGLRTRLIPASAEQFKQFPDYNKKSRGARLIPSKLVIKNEFHSEQSGLDATDYFEDRYWAQHHRTCDAGRSTIPARSKYTPPKQPHYNQNKTSEFIIKILKLTVPLTILGLAVAIRMYTKSEPLDLNFSLMLK
ncbi:hypothetical protein BRADI_5g26980v3 [Brachypodium distachyon]|uniref:Uncharacterized protein n=1 Tax=Brachypodium distachyon TaxID=15368 RepID=I1J3M6_BRADI|nr:hypothetical protein BRADI_5g26980v3 [Brachypodium distachyon]